MAWRGSLQLDYRCDGHGPQATPRTVSRSRHDGPLRVLASLYPEAASVCHNVLVHPPGGVVGGDTLAVEVDLQPGAHALVTTAGATRFYRSTGAPAAQQVVVRAGAGARFEWLPLETIAFSGCLADNSVRFALDEGAETIGWDVLALGLPASDLGFERGRVVQTIEWPGHWLERGVTVAEDRALLDSPLGWAGHRVLATMWFASGSPLPPERRDALLDAARRLAAEGPLARSAGSTSAHEGLVVLRALGGRVEPVMALLTAVWAAWREAAWQLPACVPRVWRT